jgi:hypothetical protein
MAYPYRKQEKMMKTRSITYILLISIVALSGCYPAASTPIDPAVIYTAAAKTIEATIATGASVNTLSVVMNSATPSLPTNTPAPVDTIVPSPELPTQTPLPTIQPTSTSPMIGATENTNCREGPGSQWDIQSGLMVGQKVRVLGKSISHTWWYIEDPDGSATPCWVWTSTTVVDGNTNGIPEIETPPTPTPVLPIISLSGSADPAEYTGACPVDITVNGTIKTNMAADVTYYWSTTFGKNTDYSDYTFKKAGSKTFSDTIKITANTDGNIRFRVTDPVSVKSDLISLKVTCTP